MKIFGIDAVEAAWLGLMAWIAVAAGIHLVLEWTRRRAESLALHGLQLRCDALAVRIRELEDEQDLVVVWIRTLGDAPRAPAKGWGPFFG